MSEKVKRPAQTRVSSKHQITIPIEAFRSAGLKPGDTLKVEATGRGRVVLTQLDAVLDRYAGCVKGGFPEGFIEDLRSEWR